MSKLKTLRWVAALLAAGALAGSESQLRLSSDYGVAVRQDTAAQIADPDAKYAGDPQPGSNPERTKISQQRYVDNKVIQPITLGSGTTGGGSGYGSGGGSGGGGGAAGGQ